MEDETSTTPVFTDGKDGADNRLPPIVDADEHECGGVVAYPVRPMLTLESGESIKIFGREPRRPQGQSTL